MEKYLNEENLTELYNLLITYGLQIIAAAAIFVIGKWVAKIVKGILVKVMHKANVDDTLAKFISSLVYVVLMVFVIVAAIGKLGVQTTSFVAIIGAAGLAVGMALQGSLANFAAGVMLILFRPFKAGDVIEAAGVVGKVESIQIFCTIIRPADNRRIIVPNAGITGGNIVNISDVEYRRVDMTFGISYGDSMKKAKEVLMGLLEKHPKVLKDPAPVVAISELADSSVNLVCRPYAKPGDYWDVYFDITEQGKEALEAAGITIPFPQQDVYMHQVATNV